MGNTDTIAAIATPFGRGGIGVVRVSGKNVPVIAHAILGYMPRQRYAELSKFLDEDGSTIDQGIVLYYHSPGSYTGEDVLELQGHGGPLVMNMLLSRCLAVGARLAEPGEFTLRAFLNNKLDLAQAESVADVIDASTSQAARCAMRSLQGEFSVTICNLVQLLINLRTLVEATLDFPEEEIAPPYATMHNSLDVVREQLERVLTSARQGSLLREGAQVVLAGQPNVGKSSLMNRLAGEELSIVTEVPGTTRDAIRQSIEIEGVSLHLIDTAGLRETEDPVEKIGVAHTKLVIEKADLVLLLIDSHLGVTIKDQKIIDKLSQGVAFIKVFNKIDLLKETSRTKNEKDKSEVYISVKTGAGIDFLRQRLLEAIGWRPHSEGGGIFMARQRHLVALAEAKNFLEEAAKIIKQKNQLELLAEELRLAQQALSLITGEFKADDLLGEIFSHFCIGK